MTNNVNKIIYSDINQELNKLIEIIPDNKNLIKLQKATSYFKNDKEGLLIIRNGLKNIMSSVSKIKRDGNSKFTKTIKNILENIKYK